MPFNPYVGVTVVMAILYLLSLIRSSQLLSELGQKAAYEWPVSKKNKFVMAKAIIAQTKSTELHKTAKKFYFYILLGYYTVWVGFAAFVLLMIFYK